MKEEFTELGRQLKELAEKYGYKYLTLSFVNGSVIGNSSASEEDYVNIFIFNEILEKEAYRLGLKQSRIKPKQVVQLTKDYKIENVFDSLQQIEKTLGFSSGNISQVCNKKRISAYGYIWRYADE